MEGREDTPLPVRRGFGAQRVVLPLQLSRSADRLIPAGLEGLGLQTLQAAQA